MIFKVHKFDNNKLLKEIKESKKLERNFKFFIGVLISAISFNLFIKPCHLIFGVSGISIMTEKLYGIDPSIVILIGNVLLLILSYACLGLEDTKRTVVGSILYPVLIKLTDFIPNYINLENIEFIVIALCGAILSGIGTGLIFKNNFTSGGTDVLRQVFSKYGKMSYSKANIYSEGLIMILGGIVFGPSSLIYSVIVLIVSGYISDRVILGISDYKTLQIITDRENNIKEFIIKNLNHGITQIDAKGAYSGKNKKVLLCAVPTREYFIVTEGIKRIDPDAFVIAIDTYEIQGK